MSRRRGPRGAAGSLIGTSLIGTVLAAAGARGAYALLRSRPPGGTAAWTRTNHRGELVTLLEGPAAATGAALAAALTPGLPVRTRAALVTAAAGAGAFGGYDDLAGSGDRRGFRGHLGALAHGEVTTGAAGLAAGALLGGGPLDVAVNAGLIAGGANLLNLFDLRPGRAVKVAALAGGLIAVTGRSADRPVSGATLAGLPLGAALALVHEDLGERAMLGDAGANALGAMLGAATAGSMPRSGRVAVLAGIVVLTAASEKVSFTKVIQRTPPLHWLDMLGRRPVAAPAGGPPDADRDLDRTGADGAGADGAGPAGTGTATHQPVTPRTSASPP